MSHHRLMLSSIGLGVTMALIPGAKLLAQSTPSAPILQTVGSATVRVRPDLAMVTINFNAVGRTPLEAGLHVAARADSLRRGFQALGIPRDSLLSGNRWYWWRGRVERVISEPRYLQPMAGYTGPARFEQDTSFRAFDAIQLRIRDLTKIGPAIDTALAHEILEFSEVTFAATSTLAEMNDALREATIDARRQATTMAEAAGVRLGRLASLTTQAPRRDDAYFTDGITLQLRGGRDDQGTQVIYPLIPVTATVYATWAIQDPR